MEFIDVFSFILTHYAWSAFPR